MKLFIPLFGSTENPAPIQGLMLHVSDTAYPRLKAHPTERDLEELFTPNLAELTFAYKYTRRLGPRVALLVLLKTFQWLGYFVKFADVPPAVIQQIIRTAQCPNIPDDITTYDNSTYRVRYVYLVRIFMNVSAFDAVARRIVIEASVAAARTRDDLADIINIAIEELVRQRYELPVFNTLLHIARTARSAVNRGYHRHIHQALDEATKARLQVMLHLQSYHNSISGEQVVRFLAGQTHDHKNQRITVMTPSQSEGLDGCEQPHGLPGLKFNHSLELAVLVRSLGIKLLLISDVLPKITLVYRNSLKIASKYALTRL